MIHLLLFASILLPPEAGAPPQDPTPPAATEKIPWFSGTLDKAIVEGKSKGKMVLGFYRSDQDPGSATMSRTTFSDDRVAAALANFVCVRVNYESRTAVESLVPTPRLPVIVWWNADGTPRDRIDGVYDPDAFLGETVRVVNDLGTINDLRRKLIGREKDVDAHFELFLRLRSTGDLEGTRAEKAAILSLDPEGVSRARLRFRYEEITTQIENYWYQKHTLPMDKIQELRAFVELQDDPEIVWDGWMRLANTHEFLERQAEGKPEEAKAHRSTRRDCLSRAWRGIPQTPAFLHDWCLQVADIFWSQRSELSEADKSFFLSVTTRMMQMFDAEADTFAYRACALKLTGKLEDAKAAARKAIELAPDDPKYKQLLTEIQSP